MRNLTKALSVTTFLLLAAPVGCAKHPKKIVRYGTTLRRIPQEEAFGEAVKWYDRHLRREQLPRLRRG